MATIVIRARLEDETAAGLRSFQRGLDRARRGIRETGRDLEGMRRRLRRVGDGFRRFGRAAGRALRMLARGAAAAGVALLGVATGVGFMTNRIAESTKNIQRWNQITGLSVTALDALDRAARRYGLEVDTITEAQIAAVDRAQAALLIGGDGVLDFFREFGIDAASFVELDPAMQLQEMARAATAAENPVLRAAIASALFGDEAVKLLPVLTNLANVGLDSFITGMQESGDLLDEQSTRTLVRAGSAWDLLRERLAATASAVAVRLAPTLTAIYDWLRTRFIPLIERTFNPILDDTIDRLEQFFGLNDRALPDIRLQVSYMPPLYRADTIGSILRPAYLHEARQAWQAGQLALPEFKRIEDRAVNEAIVLQETAGLEVVTDGEMRRLVFTGTLTEAIDGIEPVQSPSWQWHGKKPEDDLTFQLPVCVTGKIRRRRSLATEEFAYARGRTDKLLKMTLPSPLMLALFWSPEHSSAAYTDPFALFTDAVDILRQEVRELVDLGCQYIQIDAPELATLVDESQRQQTYEARGISTERMLNEGVEMLNTIADAAGVTFGLHMCKGNNAGHWMSQGGYEAISKQVFQRATHYDIVLLEYDDWRSGSFEPLADIPRDKTVVLGLVSTKTNTLEPADGLVARINEASQHFPREQLALSTQCGFASVAQGNPISPEVQEQKLRLVVDVAQRVW